MTNQGRPSLVDQRHYITLGSRAPKVEQVWSSVGRLYELHNRGFSTLDVALAGPGAGVGTVGRWEDSRRMRNLT